MKNEQIISNLEKLCQEIDGKISLDFYQGISEIEDFDNNYIVYQNGTITKEQLVSLKSCSCFGCNPIRKELIIGDCDSIDMIEF